MTSKRRILKLEATLAAKEKFSLWLHRAKAAGGFVAHWEKELKGPLAPFEWFADQEAYFLFRLVNDVNFAILNNASKNQDLRSFAHFALDGMLRRICRLDKSSVFVPVHPIPENAALVGKKLFAKFKSLLEETELLAAAIVAISGTHLGGEDILFSDTRVTLDAEVSKLRTTADVYGSLAEWLNLEPITVGSFDPGHPMVDAKAGQIVHISRAEGLASGGDRRKFIDALQRAFPELVEGGL